MKKILLVGLLIFALVLVGCGGKTTKTEKKVEEKKQEVEQKAEEKKEDIEKKAEEKKEDVEKKAEEKKEAVENKVEGDKPVVTVTTSFLYDMTKVLAGDFVTPQLIIPAGEDPHLYVAKPEDNQKVKDADLVLYHGLHFEGKMAEILEQYGKAVSEGFPEEKLGKMEDEGQEILDPHFWFDLDLYKIAVQNASKHLQALVKDHAADIKANEEAYLKELDKLNEENKAALEQIPAEHRYLITPHDAFNYFSRAYNIEVVAPQGVSTDSEVANKDIETTVNFIVDHKVKAIFAESTTDPARMEKLKEACKAKGFDVEVVSGEGKELFSDSLAPEGQDGDSFLDMYRHNVNLIVEHLK